jgi:hypothetical protein
VYNLELESDLALAIGYLDRLKAYMHEMTGVPENALGQEQSISNTSGVALSIQYQPLMAKWSLKKTQYGEGIERINKLVIKTMALKEPDKLRFDPSRDTPLQDGQLDMLNPADPVTYRTTTHFQPPLPIDQLIALNEIMTKMQLGLESKRGALVTLGEEFPDEKLEELQEELIEDAKRQAALDWQKAEMQSAIETVTGVPLGENATVGENGPAQQGTGQQPAGPQQVASAGGPGVNSAGAAPQGSQPLPGASLQDPNELLNQLTTRAFGTKLPQRRKPESDT